MKEPISLQLRRRADSPDNSVPARGNYLWLRALSLDTHRSWYEQSLAFGASALFATAASSAPLSNGLAVVPDNGIEQVRMVCNEYGRCWRERGRRVVIQENYGPRYRRGYYDGGYYNDGPRVGIGVGPGGVGIGFGGGPRW